MHAILPVMYIRYVIVILLFLKHVDMYVAFLMIYQLNPLLTPTGTHTQTHTRALTPTGVLGFEQACSVWMQC